MKGCRALSSEEIQRVTITLEGARDKALFILGVSTGFRISELLSLKVKDVWENGKSSNWASVSKCNTKGEVEGRTVKINAFVQKAISDLVLSEGLKESDALFTSRKGGAIGRKQAWRILKEAYKAAELTGKTGTHSMRKSLALATYKASGKDLLKTQKVLGHKSLNSTTSYLATCDNEVDDLVTGLDLFKAS